MPAEINDSGKFRFQIPTPFLLGKAFFFGKFLNT
jgi:hypothetical protein